MQRRSQGKATQALIRRHQRLIWQRVVMVLAAIVVFCTTYALILPAITQETSVGTVCGLIEHQHTDACFTQLTGVSQTTLVCTPQTLGLHTHTDACYDAAGALICGTADFVLHTHDSLCYAADGSLRCALPEVTTHVHDALCYGSLAGHTHTDACWLTVRGELLCTLAETAGHTHGDVCYTVTETVICPLAETVGHTHGEGCYTSTETLTCTLTETAGHTHGESCYASIETVTCLLAETAGHAHGDACYTVTETVTCPLAETVGHTHGDACYTSMETVTCTLPEDENHTHSEACRTVTQTLICTQVESAGHTHGEACRTVTQTLVCTQTESEGHTHGEACRTVTRTLVCTQDESEGHTHSEACRTVMQTLICTLVEAEGHTHGETCRTVAKTLACVLAEEAAHVHTDACFAQTQQLVCTESTNAAVVLLCVQPTYSVHTHSAACYTGSVLTCGQLELAAHSHTEACFTTTTTPEEQLLSCTLPVHVHTDACRLTADLTQVETAEQWTAALPELTGDRAADLVAVAQSQLGYTESSRNYIITADGLAKGYTRYGDWYGDPYGDWSSMFAAFCVRYAYIGGMPMAADPVTWIELLSAEGLYRPAAVGRAAAGTLIFLDKSGDGVPDAVGVVTGTTADGGIVVIEGDAANCVQMQTYAAASTSVVGYGMLPEVQESVDCGLNEHAHGAGCYGADGRLICVMPTHTHSFECVTSISLFGASTAATNSGYTTTTVNQVVTPSTARVNEFDTVRAAYKYDAQDIPLSFVAYGNGSNTIGDFVNSYYSGEGNTFYYFYAYLIEEVDGYLQVTRVIESGAGGKLALKPSSTGFVLLTYDTAKLASVGDNVSINFNYKAVADYRLNSDMVIGFIKKAGTKKTYTNNTGLATHTTVSTRDFIEINLYDYGSGSDGGSRNINAPNNGNNNLPAFQQDEGAPMQSTLAAFNRSGGQPNITDLFNFGNNITSDLADGKRVTGRDYNPSDINKVPNISDVYTANVPLSNVYPNLMTKTLSGGYPAFSGNSLGWLFGQTYNGQQYSYKVNDLSIDHLFQLNPTTGEYHFNSRTEFAQYNSADDTFTVYQDIVTPNFILYPFGNFLPLNNIVTQTTKVTNINRQYFVNMMNNAQWLYKSSSTNKLAYARLASSIGNMLNNAQAKGWGTNWNYSKLIEHYFNLNGLPYNASSIPTGKLYNIDYDEESNFYFGMEIRMDFMMPKDGKVGTDRANDGMPDYDMIFEFTGDDDVWVYIDDVLFLDLSGIHRHVGGKIDFVNGTVHYYNMNPDTGEVDSEITTMCKTFAQIFKAAGKTVALESGTFKDYTTHSFDFFYMERGSGSSVCQINFNFPLIRRNAISVEKELTVEGQASADYITNIKNLDFSFQILKAGTETPFIGQGVYYYLYDENDQLIEYTTDANGNASKVAYEKNDDGTLKSGPFKTGANGIFTLKPGQRAEFPGIAENSGKYYVRERIEKTAGAQYGEIKVSSGEVTTEVNGKLIDSASFYGYDSPEFDPSSGKGVQFTYNNVITPNKLGSLAITKAVPAGQVTGGSFIMNVTLDGDLLPSGTVYTIGSSTCTVGTPGQIVLMAGQTAVIPNILLGTDYVVTEDADSATGFVVSYTNNVGEITEEAQNAVVTVTNTLTSYLLPETGGGGTAGYWIGGMALLIFAVWRLILVQYANLNRRKD